MLLVSIEQIVADIDELLFLDLTADVGFAEDHILYEVLCFQFVVPRLITHARVLYHGTDSLVGDPKQRLGEFFGELSRRIQLARPGAQLLAHFRIRGRDYLLLVFLQHFGNCLVQVVHGTRVGLLQN